MPEVMHRYSVELLVHFQCGECKQWWTIGDWDKTKEELFCPACGTKAQAVPWPESSSPV